MFLAFVSLYMCSKRRPVVVTLPSGRWLLHHFGRAGDRGRHKVPEGIPSEGYLVKPASSSLIRQRRILKMMDNLTALMLVKLCHFERAGDGDRTRDVKLGKLAFYR